MNYEDEVLGYDDRFDVLLIEDNDADVALAKEALKQSQESFTLNVVKDGRDVISFLKEHEKPTLILLDLNMPTKSGIDVLTEIKEDSKFKTIPVVILSTSDNIKDICESYDAYANAYITKPSTFDDFVDIIKSIKKFWVNIARIC